MKWKQVLYSLIVGVGITISMTACSRDNEDGGKDPGDKDLPEGYFAFQSSLESSKGKVRAEDPGTDEENRVSRVRIVLFDAVTNRADYAFDISGDGLHKDVDAQDFEGTCMLAKDGVPGYNPDHTSFMLRAMRIDQKAYKMLVLINPNAQIISDTKAAKEYENKIPTISDATPTTVNTSGFSDATAFRGKTGTANGNNLSAFVGTNNPPNNFLMSNYQEYVDLGVGNFYTNDQEALSNPVSVKVDRAVAKVHMVVNYGVVASNSSARIPDGSGAWRLDITNKTGYWMRHKTAALGGGTENPAKRDEFYAEDPNFDLFSWERYTYNNQTVPAEIVAKGEPNNFFNYIADADVNLPLVDQVVSYEYALENTMAASEQYEDVTTAAILKIVYIPLKSAIGTDIGSTETSYYVWGGKVLTAADLVKIRNYDTSTNDPEFASFLTLQTHLVNNKTDFDAEFGENFDAGGASRTFNGITYNADGVNYYRILIRHFSDAQEPNDMGYGRYGIVRNSYYKLTLLKVTEPGDINVPKPNGSDDKKRRLSVSIEVNPWTVREQPVVIE